MQVCNFLLNGTNHATACNYDPDGANTGALFEVAKDPLPIPQVTPVGASVRVNNLKDTVCVCVCVCVCV